MWKNGSSEPDTSSKKVGSEEGRKKTVVSDGNVELGEGFIKDI